MTGTGLPLDGVRVVEMTHMVMGPTCGMILAQLGAGAPFRVPALPLE
jgi:crotonobetainyl-CoA:carnitine CoA-transferase CaiB-like acyl-CoA transferase